VFFLINLRPIRARKIAIKVVWGFIMGLSGGRHIESFIIDKYFLTTYTDKKILMQYQPGWLVNLILWQRPVGKIEKWSNRGAK
jgi:hypothetical protein